MSLFTARVCYEFRASFQLYRVYVFFLQTVKSGEFFNIIIETTSRGGSRIFEGGVAGVECGRAPKAPAPRGVRGHAPPGNFEISGL